MLEIMTAGNCDIKYEKALKTNREKQLTILAKQAQLLNLGY
jgi:hypothetical protein